MPVGVAVMSAASGTNVSSVGVSEQPVSTLANPEGGSLPRADSAVAAKNANETITFRNPEKPRRNGCENIVQFVMENTLTFGVRLDNDGEVTRCQQHFWGCSPENILRSTTGW